jgi:hypothetical protein
MQRMIIVAAPGAPTLGLAKPHDGPMSALTDLDDSFDAMQDGLQTANERAHQVRCP